MIHTKCMTFKKQLIQSRKFPGRFNVSMRSTLYVAICVGCRVQRGGYRVHLESGAGWSTCLGKRQSAASRRPVNSRRHPATRAPVRAATGGDTTPHAVITPDPILYVITQSTSLEVYLQSRPRLVISGNLLLTPQNLGWIENEQRFLNFVLVST